MSEVPQVRHTAKMCASLCGCLQVKLEYLESKDMAGSQMPSRVVSRPNSPLQVGDKSLCE